MPPSFLRQIDSAAARTRRRALLTGVAWTLGAALGAALLLVLIDWFGRFSDPGMRWLLSGVYVALVAAVVTRRVDEVQKIETSRVSIARRVEALHPELGSRLASSVEFAEQEPEDSSAGSAELRRSVVVGAAAETEGLDFDEVIDRRPLMIAGRSLSAVVFAFVLTALFAGPTLSLGLARLAAPWASLDWPRRNVLVLVEPVQSLAVGQTLEVVAKDESGLLPQDVRVEYRFTEGSRGVESQAMRLVGDQAVAERDNVRDTLEYRVVGGDDQTMSWTALTLHEPPGLTSLRLSVTPPEYTGLQPGEVGRSIRVIQGTRIGAEGTSDLPLTKVNLDLGDQGTIDAEVLAPTSTEDPIRFRIGQDAWIAEPSADQTQPRQSFTFLLQGERGITGRSEPAPYEVLVDRPPVVAWSGSSEDRFVTARAVVPILATVEDDLAIWNAELRWDVNPIQGDPQPEQAPDTQDGVTPLYSGPDRAPARDSLQGTDEVAIDAEWDLQPLGLAPGTRLDLVVTASDYRPGIGTVELPRRVFIVTDEEFEQRLANKQSRLLAEVQRALESQRGALSETKRLTADLQATKEVDAGARDRLTSLSYAQRQAQGAVNDNDAGARVLAERLLGDLRRNRLDRPELESQLASALEGLEEVGTQALPDAAGELASARRAADQEDSQQTARRLQQAAEAQNSAALGLEQIAQGLTGWSDYQRFAREISQLAEQQEDLAQRAAREAAAAAGGDSLRIAKGQAQREKLLAEQAEASRRLEGLQEAMRDLLANQPPEGSGAAEAVSDALTESERNNVSGAMRDASRELAVGRLGVATEEQQRAAEGLRRMLDALRQRGSSDPEELIEQLREAQQQLAQMQQDADQLGGASPQSAEQMSQQAESMSRRLDRLTAPDAAASAQQASQSLSQSGGQGASASQQREQAQQAMQQAQQQIEERIQELEDQQTQRALDRLAGVIDGYIDRQRAILDATLRMAEAAPAADPQQIAQQGQAQATEQGALGDEVQQAAEEVAARAIFRSALQGAERSMRAAAEGLSAGRLGVVTQRSEFAALQRLRHIAQVLKENQSLQEQQEQSGEGGQGGGGQQQPPSPIDVAELRMLRLMQLDLMSRTDSYEADAAEAQKTEPRLPPEWADLARRLSGEQRELFELALEMANRDNDPEAAPPPTAEPQREATP